MQEIRKTVEVELSKMEKFFKEELGIDTDVYKIVGLSGGYMGDDVAIIELESKAYMEKRQKQMENMPSGLTATRI